jgi:hypothetical protein
MSAGETDEILTAALADDLMGVLSSIPPAECSVARFRAEALGYFERQDHVAVEISSDLGAVSMTMRPITAYGRVLLERQRRITLGPPQPPEPRR